MKHFIAISILSFVLVFQSMAQSDEFVITWPVVVNEVKRADDQANHAKRGQRSRTWTERGRKYIELYSFDKKDAYPGLPLSELIHAMKTTSRAQRTEGDTLIHSFDRIDLYFVNNELVKYERTGDALPHFPTKTAPLDIAVESYFKAAELEGDKRNDVVGAQLKLLIDLYTNEGFYYIKQNNYPKADMIFEKIAHIILSGFDNNTDEARANLLNDCGTVAYWGGNYDNAIKFYSLAIEKGINTPELYGTLMNSYMQKGDTTSAITTLHTIIEKFPSDSNTVEFVKVLVNLYLDLKQFDEALAYLYKALEQDPNNTSFLVNIGILHETNGDTEKAIEYYKRTIEIEPNNLGANANLGLLFAKQAREILQEASAAFGTRNYRPLNEKGQALLKQSIPFYIIYAENETDLVQKRNAYTDLMSIYSQLRMDADYDKTRAKRDAIR